MSRYIKEAPDKTMIYGWDHALGYFYEEWVTSTMNEDEATPFSDRCSMFGMPKHELIEKMHQYRVKESHLEAIALDLPI